METIEQEVLKEVSGVVLDMNNKIAEQNKKINLLETVIKRSHRGVEVACVPYGQEGNDLEEKVRKDFAVAAVLNRDKKNSITPRQYEEIQPIDSGKLNDYTKALQKYIRSGPDYIFEAERKSLSEGIGPDGGFLVSPVMSNRIIERQNEVDPIRRLASVESITTNQLDMLVDWESVGASWVSETGNRNESTHADWKGVSIFVHEIYSRLYCTQLLLEDSVLNVENWIAKKMADEFSIAEGAAFITGDGIGKPRGILTHPDGTTWGTIEQIHLGAAATLTGDGFLNLKYSLKSAHQDRAAFLMNRDTLSRAMRLKDGIGNYLWQPSFVANVPSTLCGLPVFTSPTMPVVAAGAMAVVCADFKEACLVVDRVGFNILRDPYTSASNGNVLFHGRKRVGLGITNYDAIKIGTIEA